MLRNLINIFVELMNDSGHTDFFSALKVAGCDASVSFESYPIISNKI